MASKCKSDLDFNPNTKRCVKKCKNTQKRNDAFKCVSNKNKTFKSKSPKKCNNNQELNPNTQRCVKKCLVGQIRNGEFKCVSNKNKTPNANNINVEEELNIEHHDKRLKIWKKYYTNELHKFVNKSDSFDELEEALIKELLKVTKQMNTKRRKYNLPEIKESDQDNNIKNKSIIDSIKDRFIETVKNKKDKENYRKAFEEQHRNYAEPEKELNESQRTPIRLYKHKSTPYKILNVPNNVSEKELKKIYKKLSLKYHPDKNPEDIINATERFKIINLSYQTICQEKGYDC